MRQDYLKADNETQTTVEKEIERALRPLTFDDFTGQAKILENLKIYVLAARQRKEALDHVLLHGPPGLGKTTLSNIIANELGERESIPPYVVVPKIIPGYEEYFRGQMLGARLEPPLRR